MFSRFDLLGSFYCDSGFYVEICAFSAILYKWICCFLDLLFICFVDDNRGIKLQKVYLCLCVYNCCFLNDFVFFNCFAFFDIHLCSCFFILHLDYMLSDALIILCVCTYKLMCGFTLCTIEAADMLQKLSLDTQTKTENSQSAKKVIWSCIMSCFLIRVFAYVF